MNKHFEDTRYYLKRARETATAGVAEELEPVQERVRTIVDRGEEEEEVTENRIEELRSRLEELAERAEGDTREAIQDARERLGRAKGEQSSET